MTDDVLTPEEKEAIAESVREGDDVEVVDLTQGDRTLRRRLRHINPAVQRFGRSVREVIARILGLVDGAPESSPELVGPAQAIQEVMSAPAVLRVSVNGDEVGFVLLDTVVCFALVEHQFGNSFDRHTEWTPPDRSSLTEIEKASIGEILQRVRRNVVDGLTQTLSEDKVVEARWADVTASAFDGIDIALFVKTPMQIGTQQGYGALLGLPSIIDVLGGQSLDNSQTRAWVTEGVLAGPVDLVAVLGTVRLGLHELIALEPGDALWLDNGRSEPITVEVQDVSKFRAEPVHRNGMISLNLVSEVQS